MPACPESSCHGLPEFLYRLDLIWQNLFRLFNRSFCSMSLVIENDLVDSLFLLNRLGLIDYGEVVNI